MITVFLVEPTVLGLAIASTAIALVCLYVLSKLNYSRRLLARNAEYFSPDLVRLAHSKAVTEFTSAGTFQPEAVQVCAGAAGGGRPEWDDTNTNKQTKCKPVWARPLLSGAGGWE